MDVTASRGGSCVEVRRALPLLAGGDLATQADAWPWGHLRNCPRCRQEFGSYVRAGQALRSLGDDPGIPAEFFARLQRDTIQAVAAAPRPARQRRGLRRALFAAACVLGGVVVHLATRGEDVGMRLLQQPARAATAPSFRTLTPGWVVPVSFTPSQQGLRGLQQLSFDPFEQPARPTR